MNRPLKAIFTLIATCILFQITVGTEPSPPPYGQYFIQGKVIRPAGLPLNDFVVRLVGKFPNVMPPGTLIEITPLRRRTEIDMYPAVTDTAGNFSLVVATDFPADSVALEVSGLAQPTVRGQILAIPANGIPVTATYDNPNRPSCSDCSSNPTTTTVIKGYQYNLPDQNVVLP